MSRVLAILAILLLCLIPLFANIGGDDGEPIKLRGESDLGEGYTYKPETLRRFRKLVSSRDWSLAEPARNPQGMLEAVHERTDLTFVLIPTGQFQMGSPDDEEGRFSDEGPVHAVRISTFLMCRTECAQRAWIRGGGEERSYFPGDDRPVDSVAWMESRDWCAATGLRLPSESEWEYSCRAGTRTRFSFGSSDLDLGLHAWHLGNSLLQTHRVGQRLPSPWGLHDTYGNVWEWCEDGYYDSYSGAPADGSVWKIGGRVRVLRGGGMDSFAQNCRSAVRVWCLLSRHDFSNGFRPAADLPE